MINILLYIIIVCLIVLIAITRSLQPKGLPPGPYPWPVIGNLGLLHRLYTKFGSQHNAYLHLTKEYKSNIINLYLGNSNVILVSGYDAIRKIHRNENFDARPWNEFTKMRNFGLRKGITMIDGPKWKDMRTWLLRCLKTLGFGGAEMSEKIRDELKMILEQLRFHNGDAVQIKLITAPAVINVIWSFATGEKITKHPRSQYFFDLVGRRANIFDVAGGILSIYPWIRYIAPQTSGYKLLSTINEEFRKFLMETINEHKKNYVKGEQKNLIDMFLEEMYHGKGPEAGFTEDQLLMILADLLIAALLPAAVTLDFLFLHMTIHQDVQCKLHEELDSVIEKITLPQLSDRSMLPFTEAIIAESQRLRAVVPIVSRRALNNTILDGYTIPKNSSIFMNMYSIHMDPKNFENPQSFKPERFLNNGIFVPNKNLIFFGGGHRRCPGEVVARSTIFLIFAGVMRHFQILPIDNNDLPHTDPLPGFIISPKPQKVLLIERTK